MRIKAGYIPEEIAIIYSAPEKVYFSWDDDEARDEDMDPDEEERLEYQHQDKERKAHNGETVLPAFICPADNKKSIATGESWADDRAEIYVEGPRGGYKKEKTWPVEKIVIPNKPMARPRLVNLEERMEGGRAYKIIWNEKYYCDLREDVLLDILINAGTDKGGFLRGEYIWARVGTQMKIVRVGSELHEALIDATRRSAMKPIGMKDFVTGGIYQTKKGDRGIIIGHCSTTNMRSANGLLRGKKENGVLLIEVTYPSHKNYEKIVAQTLSMSDRWSNDEYSSFRKLDNVRFRTNHTFIEKIGDIKIPEDIFPRIRKMALQLLEEEIEGIKKAERGQRRYEREHGDRGGHLSWDHSRPIARWSPLCNAYAPGEKEELPPDFKQYVTAPKPAAATK